MELKIERLKEHYESLLIELEESKIFIPKRIKKI